MMILFIAGAAVLHVTAVFFALRLIPLTGKKTAWLLIAIGILIQAVRRFLDLYRSVTEGYHHENLDVIDDFLAFAISFVMTVGLGLLKPLFLFIKHSEEVLREAAQKADEHAAERQLLVNELQIALENVKELKGIIPICSYCKKVRDDDGYWEMVELYIIKHTDAAFSHGICPQCVEKKRFWQST